MIRSTSSVLRCHRRAVRIVFALIGRPHFARRPGRSSSLCAAGVVAFAAFFPIRESDRQSPCSSWALFTARLRGTEHQTFAISLAVLFFFVTIFSAHLAGYSVAGSGLTIIPMTLVMFALSGSISGSSRSTQPALLHGRWSTDGAVRCLLLLQPGLDADYMTDLLRLFSCSHSACHSRSLLSCRNCPRCSATSMPGIASPWTTRRPGSGWWCSAIRLVLLEVAGR